MGIISVSSGAVYVRSGSDISGCDMTCRGSETSLELHRECGGENQILLDFQCYYNVFESHDPRLRLDAHSGCWTLTPARTDDSCVYKVWGRGAAEKLISSTEIRVLDPVLISNISGTVSRLGEEMAVSVQFSGEESAVTWEEDGEPLPERYRLIDDNRTLIIPSVQRDDAERTFRVRITNPVSEETKDYKLSDDPIFSKVLEAEGPRRSWLPIVIGVLTAGLIICIVCLIYCRKIHRTSNGVPKDVPLMEVRSVPTNHNGSSPNNEFSENVPLTEDGSKLSMQNGSLPSNGAPEDMPLMEAGSKLSMQNGSLPSNGIPEDVPLMEVRSVLPNHSGCLPNNEFSENVPLTEAGSKLSMQYGSLPSNGVP